MDVRRRSMFDSTMDPKAPVPAHHTLATFLWICAGGAAGTGVRWLVSTWALKAFGPRFPWGTLAVNLLGSFLMGALMHAGTASERLSPTLRLALTTGVLGGFTTYSAFSWESLRYLQEGATGLGVLYVAGTLAGCLLACFLGFLVGRAVWG